MESERKKEDSVVSNAVSHDEVNVEGLPQDVQTREQKRAMVLNSWVERERQRQRLSATYFQCLSFWLHFFPISLFTLLSGILCTMYSVKIDDNISNGLQLRGDDIVWAAGLLSLFTTFWNAIGGRTNHGGKYEQHNLASLALQRIELELDAILITGVYTYTDKKKVRKLEEEVLGIPRNLTSLVPNQIVEAFNLLEQRIKTFYSTQRVIRRIYKEENELQKVAYGELAAVISSYYFYPLFLPSPRKSVSDALKRLKISIVENATIFDDIEEDLTRKAITDESFYAKPISNNESQDASNPSNGVGKFFNKQFK